MNCIHVVYFGGNGFLICNVKKFEVIEIPPVLV